MTPARPDHTDREHPVDVDTDQPRGDSPRSTSNPTGEKQAAENVENEPAG